MGGEAGGSSEGSITQDGEDDLARFTNPPPPVLYHYTTVGGLKGIIQSGKIWATDLAFLNDRHELEYGLGLVRQSILGLDNGKWTEEAAEFILNLRGTPPVTRIMVACFSEPGDQLGQWRGYAQQQGYSIGFDVAKITPLLARKRQGDRFFPVSYDVGLSRSLAGVWARDLMKAWEKVQGSDAWPPKPQEADEAQVEALAKALYEFTGEYVTRAAIACSYVKDPSFCEEREWRMVVPVVPKSDEHSQVMNFREGPLGLTPYVEIDLRDDDGRVPLASIVLSPGDDADLRATAVKALLFESGYENTVEVRESTVPFRP